MTEDVSGLVELLREALEPFAKYSGDRRHLKQRFFLQLLVCPEGDDHPSNYGPHFDRARDAIDALSSLSLQLAAVEGERDEFQRLFDQQWKRTREAGELWRQAHPGNDLVSPDLGELVKWLMERAETAEASLSAAQEENERLRKALEGEYSHEDRIALASCLSWNVTEVTPSDVKGILDRLSTEGYRIVRSHSSEVETDEDEAYEIGKRDGYSEAVQQIDQLTGGDGEYRFCTDHDPERHTPGPAEMIQRIVDRFEILNTLEDISDVREWKRRANSAEASLVRLREERDELVAAYKAYLDASDLYNERLAISKTKALGTMRVDEERRAIDDARRAFDKLAVTQARATLSTPSKEDKTDAE